MELDATVAIHLVSYWLFCGGGGEWPSPLEVACSWLGDSLLNTAPNAIHRANDDGERRLVCLCTWVTEFRSG